MASKADSANAQINNQKIWLHELREVVVASGSGNCDLQKLSSMYYGYILWLNLQLFLTVTIGTLRESPESKKSMDGLIRILKEAFPEILKLHQLLPKQIFHADDVVSYAGQHSRSWAGVVVELVQGIVSIASNESCGISSFTAAQLLGQRGFDEGFVRVHLEIEREQIQSRIAAAGGARQTAAVTTKKSGDTPAAPAKQPKSKNEKYRNRITLILAAWEEHHFRKDRYHDAPMTKTEAETKTTIDRRTLGRTMDEMFGALPGAGWNRYVSLCSDSSAMQRQIKRLRRPTIAQAAPDASVRRCSSCSETSEQLREHESDALGRPSDAPQLLYCERCWANR